MVFRVQFVRAASPAGSDLGMTSQSFAPDSVLLLGTLILSWSDAGPGEIYALPFEAHKDTWSVRQNLD